MQQGAILGDLMISQSGNVTSSWWRRWFHWISRDRPSRLPCDTWGGSCPASAPAGTHPPSPWGWGGLGMRKPPRCCCWPRWWCPTGSLQLRSCSLLPQTRTLHAAFPSPERTWVSCPDAHSSSTPLPGTCQDIEQAHVRKGWAGCLLKNFF